MPVASIEISACRGCQNAVIDPAALAVALGEVVEKYDLSNRMLQFHNGKLPRHLIFKAAVAGCPNACSQPQIKDFGLIGRSEPFEGGEECINCGLCVEVCPDFAITLFDGERPVIDPGICQRCAKCARVCPTGALIAGPAGVEIMAGGRMGRHPKFAETLVAAAGIDEAVRTLVQLVEDYLTGAHPGERFAYWFDRRDNCPSEPVTGVTSTERVAG